MMSSTIRDDMEWLEADGLGGFASGTVSGIRTRRYHALLLSARTPPTERFALVNGVDTHVSTVRGAFAASAHRYSPGVTTGTSEFEVESFDAEPWPRWRLRLADGTRLEHEVFVTRDCPAVVLSWRLVSKEKGVTLRVRPLLSGRDYHALHHENPAFRIEPDVAEGLVRWTPYPDVPAVNAHHNGRYAHDPVWYRNFEYSQERERGFDFREDLASPGVLEFDLSSGEAVLVLCAEAPGADRLPAAAMARERARLMREAELARRTKAGSTLDVNAESYLVRRGEGVSIIAGYPWFADWGRDTFVAMRGLCLARGKCEEAKRILLRWAGAVDRGMVPNRFPDSGEEAEFNSVDASLWFVVAAHELLEAAGHGGYLLARAEMVTLREKIVEIVTRYAEGTRYRIRMDADGLLAAGEPGVQLTWMDARVGNRVITPRIGKPVEVQALWINALRIAGAWAPRWQDVHDLARESFRTRFWNESGQCLYDVVDVDHVAGAVDASVRPNQILAVGGLPFCCLAKEQAHAVVRSVENDLLTPMGLRSLAPCDPAYAARYQGGPDQRDESYHQGTVWPWLMGPFVEAWVRVRGCTVAAKAAARNRFLGPLRDHLAAGGIGHISEILDAENPYTPRGCPFQAWSLGELLRLERVVLADSTAERAARTGSVGQRTSERVVV